MPDFHHVDVLPLGPDATAYRRLDLPPGEVIRAAGRTFLEIDPAVLTALVRESVHDIQHYLRPSHLAQLRAIVDDPEASPNDRFVATDLLRNACVSAGGVLPMCQDTGTAIVAFLDRTLRSLGTSACPPYHLAVVVGGMSAEYTLKVAKLASARYLDTLPSQGSELGHAFRDHDLEKQVLEMTAQFGIGAQFGGKYFCHDVRVVRLPRHGASLPVGIAVSCSADRQAKAKITPEGVFLEQLERDPAQYLPEVTGEGLSDEVVRVDLNRPMAEIRAQLSALPVKTRLSLSGPLVVARDIAHAKIAERLDAGEPMPGYLRDHPVYYAGPAKTPEGYASGSFGPTTAGRMDSYVAQFQAAGGSLVMLAKGNRSRQVTDSCRDHGGFYLGSIGGPAARLAQDCIRKVEVLEYPELGMEAVWKIEVEDFPAFVVVDDKGNDFFAGVSEPTLQIGFRRS
ncbi:MAG: FumA C-terminus/TtdB family hydratase beta subunit [Pseudonocardiales bacterium]|nr:FumA C-terminus/TtdB family hydratase beta subunit [Pseudonocardiales bacterium]